MTFDARLDEIDALLRETVVRMRCQDDAAIVAAMTLALVGQLTATVRELGETVGAVCWALRGRGVSPEALEAARVEMLTEFAQSTGRHAAGGRPALGGG